MFELISVLFAINEEWVVMETKHTKLLIHVQLSIGGNGKDIKGTVIETEITDY